MSVRAAPPRSTPALKITVPLFVASPTVPLPANVTALRTVRDTPPFEAMPPPLKVSVPVLSGLLVIAPTEPVAFTPSPMVPAVSVVTPE